MKKSYVKGYKKAKNLVALAKSKLPGSGGTDEILAGDNAMRSVEPPFLMNDAIVDLLTKNFKAVVDRPCYCIDHFATCIGFKFGQAHTCNN